MKDIALKSLLLAGISVGLSLTAYFGWFFVKLDLPLSKSPEAWGQFGSYMAGTVGVSMALATVWMLADTLRLQRKELGLTRKELELTRQEIKRTADAQIKQANVNEVSNSIQRSYYFIQSIETNLNTIHRELLFYIDSGGFTDDFYKNTHITEPLIESFMDQYILIIHHLNQTEKKEEKDNIELLIKPLQYKYRFTISLILTHGFIDKYKDDFHDHLLNNFLYKELYLRNN